MIMVDNRMVSLDSHSDCCFRYVNILSNSLLFMTFADQLASAFLELPLREIVSPLCKTKLVAEMLQNNRKVDDGARAHHDRPNCIRPWRM